MQDNSDLIIRDCCEAEVAEFGQPDTICITVDVLREIVQRHFPGTCLHQIQEPAAAEQAAWHAGLDEGRAQAAPAAVAAPDERAAFESWARSYSTWEVKRDDDQDFGITGYTDVTLNIAWHAIQARAALAAKSSAVACEAEAVEQILNSGGQLEHRVYWLSRPILQNPPKTGLPGLAYCAAPAALAAPVAVTVPDGWTPTVENINALPDPLRAYVHALETNADPSGMVRDNTILREQLAGLQIMFRKSQEALAATPAAGELAPLQVGLQEPALVVLPEEIPASNTLWMFLTKGMTQSAIAGMPERDRKVLTERAQENWAAIRAEVGATVPVVLPEPVGWRHSLTLTLHETEEEVQLADGDSHAQPLFTEQQVRALLAGVSAPAASEQNAQRYRWIIDNMETGSIGFGDWWFGPGDDEDEIDSAIDAAIAAQAQKEQSK